MNSNTELRLYLFALLSSFIWAIPVSYAFADHPQAHISEILTPEQTQSVYHRIEEVQRIGRDYQFYLETDFAGYSIQSMPLLRDSIQELTILGDALAQFSQQNQTFSAEIRGQLEIRANSVIDILSHPVQSVTHLAEQAVNNLDETLTGAEPDKRTSYTLQGAGSTDPGFAIHKRNIASQWDLDVYSINPKVQEFLNAVARKRGAGSISSGAPSFRLSSHNKTKMQNTDVELQIKNSLKRLDLDALFASNYELLTAMGVAEEVRDSFLQHRYYSPSYQTRIIYYLHSIVGVGNIGAFFSLALQAENVTAARAMQEKAMLLAYYHHQQTNLRQLSVTDDELQLITKDNALVVLPSGDIFYWDEKMSEMLNKLSRRSEKSGFGSVQLITSGRLTDKLKKELAKSQFTFYEGFGL